MYPPVKFVRGKGFGTIKVCSLGSFFFGLKFVFLFESNKLLDLFLIQNYG